MFEAHADCRAIAQFATVFRLLACDTASMVVTTRVRVRALGFRTSGSRPRERSGHLIVHVSSSRGRRITCESLREIQISPGIHGCVAATIRYVGVCRTHHGR